MKTTNMCMYIYIYVYIYIYIRSPHVKLYMWMYIYSRFTYQQMCSIVFVGTPKHPIIDFPFQDVTSGVIENYIFTNIYIYTYIYIYIYVFHLFASFFSQLRNLFPVLFAALSVDSFRFKG